MNSYQYINPVEGATSINVDPVGLENIYDVSREGIGIQQATFVNGTIDDVNVYQYAWQGENTSFTPNASRYFIIISDLVSGTRTITVEIGPLVTDATSYTFLIALESASYVASGGDTDEDVRDALVTAINGASWSPSVTATPISTNRIEIETDDLLSVVTANLSAYLYKVALYAEFSMNGGPVKQYLLDVASSGFTYPATPTLEASYDYDDITLAPAGIAGLITQAPYTLVTDSTNLIGTTDITEAPIVGTVAPGKYMYYEAKLYFGAPALASGEHIKMIVL